MRLSPDTVNKTSSMKKIKTNFDLVPSTWIRWVMFCELMIKDPNLFFNQTISSLDSSLPATDVLDPKKAFETIAKELCCSRLYYNSPLVGKKKEDSLIGLEYYSDLAANLTFQLRNSGIYKAESETLTKIGNDFLIAKSIVQLIRGHVQEILTKKYESQYVDSNESYVNRLKQIFEKVCVEWNVLEMHRGNDYFSQFDCFLLDIDEEILIKDQVDSCFYVLPKEPFRLKPISGKCIQFYSFCVSLCILKVCEGDETVYYNAEPAYIFDRENWEKKYKRGIDWSNYPYNWAILFRTDFILKNDDNLPSAEERDGLSTLLHRPTFNALFSEEYLSETMAQARPISIDKLEEDICEISKKAGVQELGLQQKYIDSELSYLRNSKDVISNLYITPSEAEIFPFKDDVVMRDEDDWFYPAEIEVHNYNLKAVSYNLFHWLLSYSGYQPYYIGRVDSEIVSRLVDHYITEDFAARCMLQNEIDLIKKRSKSPEDTRLYKIVKCNNLDDYWELNRYCSEEGEVINMTQLCKFLLDKEYLHPKNKKWKEHLKDIASYKIQDAHIGAFFDFLLKGEIRENCSEKQLREYIAAFLLYEDFNHEDFEGNDYYFYTTDKETKEKKKLTVNELIRKLKDGRDIKRKFLRKKFDKTGAIGDIIAKHNKWVAQVLSIR